MKARPVFCRPVLRYVSLCFAAAGCFTANPAGVTLAANAYFWNPGGVGGDGNWGSTPGDKNWSTAAGAPPADNLFWPEGSDDIAIFNGATGGVVTVIDSIQAAGIRQSGANHGINAGTITLVEDHEGNRPFIDVQSGILSVDSTLEGAAGMLKSGAGDLVLTRANTYVGQTLISSGRLLLDGSLASGEVVIGPGASLINRSGGLSGISEIINAGTLSLEVDESIANYVSSSGTLTDGAGRLNAGSAQLNGISTMAGSLVTGSLTVRGQALVSGSATAEAVTVVGGALTLSGELVSDWVEIGVRAELVNHSGGFSDTATLHNSGLLTLNADDTVATYISNIATLAGPGKLTATHAMLNEGAVIDGRLHADTLTTDGVRVRIAGIVEADVVTISSGETTLTGGLSSPLLTIAPGARLSNRRGDLGDEMRLVSSGTLSLEQDDVIKSFISNGGTLAAGAGRLFADEITLNDGSIISGRLGAASVTTDGDVSLSGSILGDTIRLQSGIFINTGTLGEAGSLLDLTEGTVLVAAGIQRYALLTTTGAGFATWQGDLVHSSTIAPGGVGSVGSLRVAQDFGGSPTGVLRMDVSQEQLDRLQVDGTMFYGGILDLNQPGTAIAPFTPVPLVTASAHSGNFSAIVETLDGAVFFNPGNGTITRLPSLPGEDALAGLTRNQTSTWLALYDDVIDPGSSNVTANPAGSPANLLSSGIADDGNPELLWTLSASFAAGGLDGRLLDHLSAGSYVAFADHAMLATRHHQRTALSAPALAPPVVAGPTPQTSAKGGLAGGAKDAAVVVTPSRYWEVFAALDYFQVETSPSRHHPDYELQATGFLTGVRTRLDERIELAAYLGIDDGSIHGDLMRADVVGATFGILGRWSAGDPADTRATAGLSFGSYRFDGSRDSVSATAAGWTPGRVKFRDVDTKVVDLFVGLDRLVYVHSRFRVRAAGGLRYAAGSMDAFEESTAVAPGAPLALRVRRDGFAAVIADAELRVEMPLRERWQLHGGVGFNVGLNDSEHGIRSRFASGASSMTATADGLDDDLLFLSLGASYQLTDWATAAIGYRGEARGSDRALHSFSISTSARF